MATFKLNPEPTFRATVDIPVAGADDTPLEVEFRHKKKDDLKAFFVSFADRSDAECLLDIVVTWHNCEAPFNAEALETLLQNYPAAGKAILAKYSQEATGARRGN